MAHPVTHGALRTTRTQHPAPPPGDRTGASPPLPRPEARLLRQARGVVTIHQKRTFLERLYQSPVAELGQLAPASPLDTLSARVWGATLGARSMLQGLTLRIIQADTQGRLFTNSSGRGDPVSQLVFWEPAPGHPQRVTVHAASIDDRHPAALIEEALPHMGAQGYREAEVRVGAEQPGLAKALLCQPGWHATPLEDGGTRFRRELSRSLPEE